MKGRKSLISRIAITGATGMLGSALVRVAIANGIDVLLIANPKSSRLDYLKRTLCKDSHVSLCLSSMNDYGKLAKDILEKECTSQYCQKPCDAFVHFAWQGTYGNSRDDIDLQENNIQNSNDAVRLAHALGCECFIGVGSQAEYGPLKVPFSSDTPCNPITGYGKAKLKSYMQTSELAQKLSMRHIWARVGSAYGPGDNLRTCMMQAIAYALRNEPFLCTPGEQLWDYLYCDDAACAILSMIMHGKDNSIYPLGSGSVRPLKDYISLACKKANPSFRPSFAALEYPSGQAMYLCADISQLKADTGFEPKIDFADGIASTIEWFCQQKK